MMNLPSVGVHRAAAVAAVAVFAFLLLAFAMVTGWTAPLDRAVVEDFHSHARANQSLADLARVVTAIGSIWSVALITALVAAGLVVAGRLHTAGSWLAAVAGGGAFEQLLKWSFRRPRPVFSDPLVSETTWGFPSGHTFGSVVCFGMAAYLLAAAAPGRRGRSAAVTAAALVVCVGFSRLYLGAHYPSDVLGSFGAGIFWLASVIAVEQSTRARLAPNNRVLSSTQTGRPELSER